MINMVKLKIGTTATEKKEKVIKDEYSELSDEELQSIEEEVAEITEADAKEAVNGMYIFEEVGIHTKYVHKFMDLYPNKKIVYQNHITKQFLKWYIKNIVNISLLDDLITDSEFIKETQHEEIAKLVEKRLYLDKDIDVDDLKEEIDKIAETPAIELDTDSEILYEFILSEKWDKNQRAKGIVELDLMIQEQKCAKLHEALINIADKFHLIFPPVKEKKEKYIKPQEIRKSIDYFHHIEFLYKLMSDKMDFTKTPTEKDKKQIKKINELLFGHLTEEINKNVKKKSKKKTKMTIDSLFEGD